MPAAPTVATRATRSHWISFACAFVSRMRCSSVGVSVLRRIDRDERVDVDSAA